MGASFSCTIEVELVLTSQSILLPKTRSPSKRVLEVQFRMSGFENALQLGTPRRLIWNGRNG